MGNLNEKLYLKQKQNRTGVVEIRSFDLNTLTQRKTKIQNVVSTQFTMDDVLKCINENELYRKENGTLKNMKTPSERIINDVRYKSNKVERFEL